MILHGAVRGGQHVSPTTFETLAFEDQSEAHHKFVNTTPKPSATKNSSGLLPPPLSDPWESPVGDGSAVGESEAVNVAAVIEVAADETAEVNELNGDELAGVGLSVGAWRA